MYFIVTDPLTFYSVSIAPHMKNIDKTEVQSTWRFCMFKRFTRQFQDLQNEAPPLFLFELFVTTWPIWDPI